MNLDLYSLIRNVWSGEIKAAYDNGHLCSERHLQAELYHHFKKQLTGYLCWVEPTLELQRDEENWKIKPDLLITRDNNIEAIIEVKNVPYAEAKFKDDIEKMVDFQNAINRQFKLITDPLTGLYKEDECFSIHDSIICVYAAIARGDYAWAVEDQNFWKSKGYEIRTPKNFLHLVGRIFKDGTNEFTNAIKSSS